MPKNLGSVHEDIGDSDPGPCSPHCPNFRRCALQLVACEAFAAFVRRDRHYWSASRFPAREIYAAVYG
jgi:hypothetical protein